MGSFDLLVRRKTQTKCESGLIDSIGEAKSCQTRDVFLCEFPIVLTGRTRETASYNFDKFWTYCEPRANRKMKRSVSFLIILSLLVVGFIIYVFRYPIAASWWHWKNGYTATMGRYVVPIPEHWIIKDQNSVAFTLMDTAPTQPLRDHKFHMAAVINIFPFQNWPADPSRTDLWLSQRRQWLEREQVKPVEEKTLKLGDESISCIGGHELSAIARNLPNGSATTDIVSMNCMSERGLNVMFVGRGWDLAPFYKLLEQIRRQM